MIKTFSGEYIEVGAFTHFWFQVPNYTYYFVGSSNVMEGPTMLDSRFGVNQIIQRKKELLNKLIKEKEDEIANLKRHLYTLND